jgi:hypothetical protein
MSDDLRGRTLQILMDQMAAGQYPSPTMLDRIEAEVADVETARRYVNMLLDAIEQERFPSPVMVDRVLGLVNAIEPAQPR